MAEINVADHIEQIEKIEEAQDAEESKEATTIKLKKKMLIMFNHLTLKKIDFIEKFL